MRYLLVLAVCSALIAGEPATIDPWELAEEAQALPERWGIATGSFILPSDLPGNASVTVHWVRPTDIGQGESPRAAEAVLYLPFARDTEFFKPEDKPWIKRMYFRFAREGGFTVLGLQFDHEAYGRAAPAGSMRLWSHPAAHATIAAAVERLRDLHRLPAVPIFTFGESGGGMFSQALAEAYPGLVDGIASTGGAAFELKGDARCPILALNTAGDYTTAANDELTDFYRARGVPVLRQLTNMEWHRRGKPSWLPFHCTNEDARQLSLRFHLALSELRHGHGGRLPSADAWPFAVRADDPRRLAATQSVGWRTALGDGPVTMLPSRSFAAAWLRVPQAPHRVPGSGPLCWRADPSPLTKPKGVVVRRWRGQQGLTTPQGLRGDDQSCALDLRYLAEQGYVAVAVNDNWSGTPAVLARLGETSLPTYAFAPQAQVDEITQIVDIAAFTQATVALPCDDDGAAALAPAQAALRRGLPLTLVVATADGTGAGSPLAVLGDALAPIPRQQQQRQRDIEDVHQQALGIAVVRFDARR